MSVRFQWLLLFAAAIGVAGCGSPDAQFRRYETFAKEIELEKDIEFSSQQRQNIDEVLQALYGTPDEPLLPALEGIEWEPILDLNRLQLAAGPVGSDEQGNPRGLYRE